MNSETITILGDLATWISALGTIGAFIVAFKQIHTERHERKRRETKEQLQAEQEQARHISAWIDASRQVVISNTSSHPVHSVTIALSNAEIIKKHTIEPGKTVVPLTKNDHDAVISDFTFLDTHSNTLWRKVPGKPLEKATR